MLLVHRPLSESIAYIVYIVSICTLFDRCGKNTDLMKNYRRLRVPFFFYKFIIVYSNESLWEETYLLKLFIDFVLLSLMDVFLFFWPAEIGLG